MWLEFADPGDPALICSAATRELARALASIGTTAEVWAFHSAVDAGPIRDGNSGNATAQGLNRASRVAKARKEELPRPAFVTQEAVAQCSPALRDGDFTASFGEQVSLTDSDVEGARVVPLTIHSEAVMRRMAQRIRAVAERIEAEAPPVAQEQSEVEVGALDRGDGDESVGSSDVAAG